ncbi:MAG TPA: VIT and VWA domain-containing protein [Candidatus Polarisedimenticolia bacterium]|nr:VIT and VWA domain-containing protein [Candidatus Polarisedimenticolia bacterium]
MTGSRFSTFGLLLFAATLCGLTAAADRRDGDVRTDGAWERVDDRFAPQPAAVSPFLLTHTDAEASVSGPVAHTVVTQQWENPNSEPVDGLYIFPLPENAAVTDLAIQVGGRRIEGVMRRREEARAIYERARTEGRVTALLDQERPNVFAQRVANIMPGMRVEVTIEFDQEVRCDAGDCSYVLPTVVGPRFVPARQVDPGNILPPVTRPENGTGQTLSFRFDLDAGMPVSDLRSVNHAMRFDTDRAGRITGAFSGRAAERLDRDVEVHWRLGGRDPEFGVIAWRDTGESREPGVFTLYVAPPIDAATDAATPRELVFVLDCSGSMSGQPIEAAKDVVRRALGSARPADTLQILRFSDRASGLFPNPVPATSANIRRALAYLDKLEGEGGTEMLSGIRAALDPAADPERLRIVAFLTDGYIGNETEILGEVRRRLGTSRIFAFGIGSSVNRYLLENLAQEGRGVAAFLGPRETPDDMVKRFVERIETPVFTDVRLTFEGIDVRDQEPAAIPDLFAGQPLVVHGRYDRPGAGALVLEGRLRGRRVTLRRTISLPSVAADHEALARLWARARIERLTRQAYGNLPPDAVTAATDLGLRFHLMTPWTSLVAVDRVVSNDSGGSCPVDVPVETPEGVSYEGIFGDAEKAVYGFGEAAQKNAPGLLDRMRSLGYVGPARAAAPPAPPMSPIDAKVDRIDEAAAEPGARGSTTAGSGASGPKSTGSRVLTPKEAPKPAFLRLVVVEEDGTRRMIESDGRAFIEDPAGRRLVRTLTAEQLETLALAIDAAGADTWSTGDATYARGRARLILVSAGGMTRSRALALLDPGSGSLLALVRAATS